MDFGITAGDTDQTIYVRLRDSTTGLAKTGLAYNSAGAVASYVLPAAARAAITLATQTVTGAHSDGGFVEVDATNCKGLYRFDLPDAAIASGKYSLISLEFDGTIEETIIVPLTLRKSNVLQLGTDTQSATDLKDFADAGYDPATNKVQGVVLVDTTTALTNAVASVTGSVGSVMGAVGSVTGNVGGNVVGSVGSISGITFPLNFGATSITAGGVVKADLDTIKTQTVTCAGGVTIPAATLASTTNITAATGITVSAIGANVITAASIAADAGTEIGTAVWATTTRALTATGLDLVTAWTVDITGSLSGSVGSVTAAITLPTIPTNWITAAGIATDAIGSAELAASATAEIADAIWDEILSGHVIAGSAGEALTAAGAAGDPWTTSLPGTYTAGQAGYIVGTNINATVSSRSSHTAANVRTEMDSNSTQLAAIVADTNELQTDLVNGGRLDLLIDGIKAKTDSLTFTVAGVVDANSTYWKGAVIATPTVAGVPEVDVTHAVGSADKGTGLGQVGQDYADNARVNAYVSFVDAMAINAASFDTGAITAAAVAADAGVEIAAAVWDRVLSGATHNITNSAGRRLRTLDAFSVRAGTAQSGASNSITLDSGASATNEIYDGNLIVLTGGTGEGQTRVIVEYNGTTKVAIVDETWVTNPDVTSEFQILADSQPDISHHGLAQAGGATSITLASTASATDDVYVGSTVYISTSTGTGQSRLITAYNGTTKVATVSPAWAVNPGLASVYKIIPGGRTIVDSLGTQAKADVNAEVDTAFTDYDPPTNAEMVARTLATADYATNTDLDALIATVGVAGLGLSAIPKTGYKLASDGLDSVLVESGISASASLTNDTGTQLTSINGRQALALVASACGAILAGAATTNITFKPAGKPAGNTRIASTVDASGNRSAITLKVPD